MVRWRLAAAAPREGAIVSSVRRSAAKVQWSQPHLPKADQFRVDPINASTRRSGWTSALPGQQTPPARSWPAICRAPRRSPAARSGRKPSPTDAAQPWRRPSARHQVHPALFRTEPVLGSGAECQPGVEACLIELRSKRVPAMAVMEQWLAPVTASPALQRRFPLFSDSSRRPSPSQ